MLYVGIISFFYVFYRDINFGNAVEIFQDAVNLF